MTIAQCYACANPDAQEGDVEKTQVLPLCTKHFNQWVIRYIGNEAPCGARHIDTQETP